MSVERTIYFQARFDINHLVTSFLLYDRIVCSLSTCLSILYQFPKKYHQLILNYIVICDIYVSNDPLSSFDDPKFYFIGFKGYTEDEFDKLAFRLRLKTNQYNRKGMDTDFLQELMMDNNGEFRGIDVLSLYDTIRILKINYYSTTEVNLVKAALNLPNTKIDSGDNDIIFEVNRLPDLRNDIKEGNFDFERFLELRSNEGAKILNEIIFKESNYNHPDELIREYNDIILREGAYSNKNKERTFWGLSNGLSVSGVFSGNIVLTIAITALSLLTGNYKMISLSLS